MSKGFLYDEGDELITRKEDTGALPDTDEASSGDVLSLDSEKKPVWSAPSGGGGHGANFVFYNVYTLNSDDRVYFWYADGTPCPINDLISSWTGTPMFFTNNDTEVSIASWDDVAFVGPSGEAKGFMIYEENDTLKVFIDSAELSLEASSNNYIAVPK